MSNSKVETKRSGYGKIILEEEDIPLEDGPFYSYTEKTEELIVFYKDKSGDVKHISISGCLNKAVINRCEEITGSKIEDNLFIEEDGEFRLNPEAWYFFK